MRIEAHQAGCQRILRGRGDLIPRERLPGEFVDERNRLARLRITQAGEIAAALGVARDGGALRDALAIAKALVIEEEEIFVSANGSAEGAAVLILFQRLYLRSEKVARIERVIADEFVKIAMKRVGSRTADHGGGGSTGAAIFGGRTLSKDAKFLDRVHGRLQGITAVHAIHVGHAIEKVVVGLGALSVHCVALPRAQRSACFGETGGDGRDSGLQEPKLREVAAVERKIHQVPAGDYVADHVRSSVNQQGIRCYAHAFLLPADTKLDIQASGLADAELNPALHGLCEIRRADAEFVFAHGQCQMVCSRAGGGLGARVSGLGIACLDSCAGEDAPGCVGDLAFQDGGGVLRKCSHTDGQYAN